MYKLIFGLIAGIVSDKFVTEYKDQRRRQRITISKLDEAVLKQARDMETPPLYVDRAAAAIWQSLDIWNQGAYLKSYKTPSGVCDHIEELLQEGDVYRSQPVMKMVQKLKRKPTGTP